MNVEIKKPAVILLSGGQDSATCLLWALTQNFSNLIAIGIDYGQKHKKELEYASRQAARFEIDFWQYEASGLLEGSALVNHLENINHPHPMNEELPASFTPARNALFLTLAANKVYMEGGRHVITGTCQTDFSGYPDCRRVFIDSMQTSLSLALDENIQIHTPLMFIDKANTWRMAKELGDHLGIDGVQFIREDTLTDYNGDETLNEWGRGNLDNPASRLRKKGYVAAKEFGFI